MVYESNVFMTEEQEILELLGYPVTEKHLERVKDFLNELNYFASEEKQNIAV